MPNQLPDNDPLLTPREVAQLFGVRTATIGLWSRQGKLTAMLTPGGHRRYRRSQVQRLLNDRTTEQDKDAQQRAEDAVRLYHQGWSIRQVADKFDCGYSAMYRILRKHGVLRKPGRTSADTDREDEA